MYVGYGLASARSKRGYRTQSSSAKATPKKGSSSRVAKRKSSKASTKVPKESAKEPTKEPTKEYFQDVQSLAKGYALCDQGLNEYIVGDYGLAAEHLSQAGQVFSVTWGKTLPQQSIFYYDLAQAQEGAGQLEAAVESYKKSVDSTWGFFDGYLGLAQLYARLGKFSDSLISINRACELKPDDPRANLFKSLILEKQGRMAEAEKYRIKAYDYVKSFGLEALKQSTDKLKAESNKVEAAQVSEPQPKEATPPNYQDDDPMDLELP